LLVLGDQVRDAVRDAAGDGVIDDAEAWIYLPVTFTFWNCRAREPNTTNCQLRP